MTNIFVELFRRYLLAVFMPKINSFTLGYYGKDIMNPSSWVPPCINSFQCVMLFWRCVVLKTADHQSKVNMMKRPKTPDLTCEHALELINKRIN